MQTNILWLSGETRRAKIEICAIKAFVPNSNNDLLTIIAKDIYMDHGLDI